MLAWYFTVATFPTHLEVVPGLLRLLCGYQSPLLRILHRQLCPSHSGYRCKATASNEDQSPRVQLSNALLRQSTAYRRQSHTKRCAFLLEVSLRPCIHGCHLGKRLHTQRLHSLYPSAMSSWLHSKHPGHLFPATYGSRPPAASGQPRQPVAAGISAQHPMGIGECVSLSIQGDAATCYQTSLPTHTFSSSWAAVAAFHPSSSSCE